MTSRLAPAEAHALAESGAVLLDVRSPAEFACGHPRGALAVPFSQRGLARRVAAVLPAGAAVVLVAPDDACAEASADQLAAGGIPVRGVLDGGFPSWRDSALPEATVREIGLAELPRPSADGALLIDVREPQEWSTGHVPSAVLISLGGLREALPALPPARTVIAICEAGIRSCTAASILAAAGFADVAHVPAGTSGYRRAGLPLAYTSQEATSAP